ncbi:hypothetical protein LY474_34300 [Myxococcus stipitatus]|uniref:hypothetical protein n=1 Tax=Myxococcus stipitatus TaxID=83455 RepID=UPI001F1C91CD|nr:hypothetical protein [Myxococcus stipitatus]MCE9672890.1 hypothetical protein [Myxococcus stipitatus]
MSEKSSAASILPPNYSPKLNLEAFQQNQRSDWFLEQFVAFMNSLDYSVGLTLSVGGTLVTGKLISPQEYFQAIGKQMEAAFAKGGLSPEVSKQVGEFIQSRGEAATPSEDLLKAAEKAAIAADVLPITGNQRAYIHLKDAGILTPSTGARMSLSGAYWRGRIAEVESFIIGEAN